MHFSVITPAISAPSNSPAFGKMLGRVLAEKERSSYPKGPAKTPSPLKNKNSKRPQRGDKLGKEEQKRSAPPAPRN